MWRRHRHDCNRGQGCVTWNRMGLLKSLSDVSSFSMWLDTPSVMIRHSFHECRVHFYLFNTDLVLVISHIVASSSDPCEIWVSKRLKLSVDATSSSPLGCLCLPAPSAFHSRSVSFDTSTHAIAQGHGIQKHSPALCLEALPLLLHPS